MWGVRELEFVCFWVAEDGVRPTTETLKAITEFPRPTDITGIRSWFGLVEQVAFREFRPYICLLGEEYLTMLNRHPK